MSDFIEMLNKYIPEQEIVCALWVRDTDKLTEAERAYLSFAPNEIILRVMKEREENKC